LANLLPQRFRCFRVTAQQHVEGDLHLFPFETCLQRLKSRHARHDDWIGQRIGERDAVEGIRQHGLDLATVHPFELADLSFEGLDLDVGTTYGVDVTGRNPLALGT